MAILGGDPASQVWTFPAAAAAVNESDSIYLGSLLELVGIEWAALQALSAKIVLEIASVDDALSVADASVTWHTAPVDKDGSATCILTATYTAVGRMVFNPADILFGPCRVRLAVYQADGTTPVNQDGEVVKPILRRV
ncbi:MAG: hypothetical protein ACYSUC_10360 [Planctomycetota bacterium]|jgi:hypothetical protein